MGDQPAQGFHCAGAEGDVGGDASGLPVALGRAFAFVYGDLDVGVGGDVFQCGVVLFQ
ncbi:hypothetical protein SDC9_208795 [bioreactor metagenome]|uniref:Uncharacterized protein n=1 Tax=bioreactor metagenome TaxID=1076179 RepID=A0A645JBN4_9ZZZZ